MSPLSTCPAHSPDINPQELERALAKGKSGKSVGIDGVSLELLRAIVEQEEGIVQLTTWFSSILHSGILPSDWSSTLMVLLPKLRLPKEVKDTRPIAIGCAAEKLFCRIVLERCKDKCQVIKPWQCSAPGRQSCDYIHAIHRLLESEREWQKGLAIVKIDFKRAFDSVDRHKLLGRLFAKLGDCEEYRVWEQLMMNTACTLRTSWDQTTFPTRRGIRQGAIESPFFFGILVEWVLEEVAVNYKWADGVNTYRDLLVSQAAYMDDILIWNGDSTTLQERLLHLQAGFREWGLSINVAKCSLYTSPKHKGPARIVVEGVELVAKDSINVMGIEFKVGANVRELMLPLWQKSKAKFFSIRHLLRPGTSLKHRLRVLDRVVGGSALWAVAALTPETSALQAINQLQFQCVIWLLGLRKGTTEDWVTFKQRSMRQARQVVCLHSSGRWSSAWLSRFWGYMGHVARNYRSNNPTCAGFLNAFRDCEWWEKEQQRVGGMRHSGRFFPKLVQLDRAMNAVVGHPWREGAQNRQLWKDLAPSWIHQSDVPWCSGEQFAIEW